MLDITYANGAQSKGVALKKKLILKAQNIVKLVCRKENAEKNATQIATLLLAATNLKELHMHNCHLEDLTPQLLADIKLDKLIQIKILASGISGPTIAHLLNAATNLEVFFSPYRNYRENLRDLTPELLAGVKLEKITHFVIKRSNISGAALATLILKIPVLQKDPYTLFECLSKCSEKHPAVAGIGITLAKLFKKNNELSYALQLDYPTDRKIYGVKQTPEFFAAMIKQSKLETIAAMLSILDNDKIKELLNHGLFTNALIAKFKQPIANLPLTFNATTGKNVEPAILTIISSMLGKEDALRALLFAMINNHRNDQLHKEDSKAPTKRLRLLT